MDADFGQSAPMDGELYGVQQLLHSMDSKQRADLTGMDIQLMLREAYDIDYGLINHNETASDSLSHVLMTGKENTFESSNYMNELLLFIQLGMGDIIKGGWHDYLELSYGETKYIRKYAQMIFSKKQSAQLNIEHEFGSGTKKK